MIFSKRFSASDFQEVILSKVHGLYSTAFCLLVFALETPLLRVFSKVHGLYKTAFSARYPHVFSFLHCGNHFLEFSVKCTSFYKTEVISPRSERFVIFALGAPLSSDIKQSAGVSPKQRFQPDISTAPFVLFALGTPLLSDFQQSGRVCTKQRFQPEISTFCLFRTGRTTF